MLLKGDFLRNVSNILISKTVKCLPGILDLMNGHLMY